MAIRKSEPTWRRTSLFTATLGISILLSGQVGHADRTTAVTPAQQPVAQPAATQDNGTAQQTATVAAGQENLASVTTQHQYGTADQPIIVISDDLNAEPRQKYQEQLEKCIAEEKQDEEAIQNDQKESVDISGQIGTLTAKSYYDYTKHPENYDNTDAPAELQEILKNYEQLKQKVATQQNAVDEEEQLVAKKKKVSDDWEKFVDEQEKRETHPMAEYWNKSAAYLSDLRVHIDKLRKMEKALWDDENTLSTLSSSLSDEIEKTNRGFTQRLSNVLTSLLYGQKKSN